MTSVLELHIKTSTRSSPEQWEKTHPQVYPRYWNQVPLKPTSPVQLWLSSLSKTLCSFLSCPLFLSGWRSYPKIKKVRGELQRSRTMWGSPGWKSLSVFLVCRNRLFFGKIGRWLIFVLGIHSPNVQHMHKGREIRRCSQRGSKLISLVMLSEVPS